MTRKRKSKSKSKRKWIQKAIPPSHRGKLTSYIKRKYGTKGFTLHKGRLVIKRNILLRLKKRKGVVGRRARLALILRKMRR